jgi:hypothetical protein
MASSQAGVALLLLVFLGTGNAAAAQDAVATSHSLSSRIGRLLASVRALTAVNQQGPASSSKGAAGSSQGVFLSRPALPSHIITTV